MYKIIIIIIVVNYCRGILYRNAEVPQCSGRGRARTYYYCDYRLDQYTAAVCITGGGVPRHAVRMRERACELVRESERERTSEERERDGVAAVHYRRRQGRTAQRRRTGGPRWGSIVRHRIRWGARGI